MMVVLFMIWTILMLLLVLVQTSLNSEFVHLDDKQMTSIESGFEKLWHTMYIGSPFFFLGVLFVLFDMELVLLLPGVSSMGFVYFNTMSMTMIMSVITITLLLEWMWSGLKWQI